MSAHGQTEFRVVHGEPCECGVEMDDDRNVVALGPYCVRVGASDAVVTTRGGQLVLDDPAALAVARTVAKHNCWTTIITHLDAVRRFVARAAELGGNATMVIVLANVDTAIGKALADLLMPGHDWQAIRDRGEVPYARGLAGRDGMEAVITDLDPAEGATLKAMNGLPLIVVDHGVVSVVAPVQIGLVGSAG